MRIKVRTNIANQRCFADKVCQDYDLQHDQFCGKYVHGSYVFLRFLYVMERQISKKQAIERRVKSIVFFKKKESFQDDFLFFFQLGFMDG